jgi:hypothetical protein
VASHPGARTRWLLLIYGIALLHVIVVFTIGEPYPSLQGPLFAGHLHQGETIYAPFYREEQAGEPLPSRDKLLRCETLGIPAQNDFSNLAPTLSGRVAREFLIGHSIRSPIRNNPQNFEQVRWSAWKFHAPPGSPPTLLGEEDIIND